MSNSAHILSSCREEHLCHSNVQPWEKSLIRSAIIMLIMACDIRWRKYYWASHALGRTRKYLPENTIIMRLKYNGKVATFVKVIKINDHVLVRGLNWVEGMLWFGIPFFIFCIPVSCNGSLFFSCSFWHWSSTSLSMTDLNHFKISHLTL